MIARDPSPRCDWLTTIRRYLLASAAGHLVWEMAQVPLYSIWRTGTTRDIATAIVHCTLGDLSIALVTLSLALVIIGSSGWPSQQFAAVLATTVVLSVGYTVYSEYVNTIVRQSWAYGPLMPILPWTGTGLSPMLQWIVVPSLAFFVCPACHPGCNARASVDATKKRDGGASLPPTMASSMPTRSLPPPTSPSCVGAPPHLPERGGPRKA